jgi:signal-transduction protein with cAMP-binding, CBS, and nucleotidyltransferase domain
LHESICGGAGIGDDVVKEGTMRTTRLIRETMTTTVQWVEPGASVRAAAAVMSRCRIGSLLVGYGSESFGIVTETDLVRRVLAENLNPASVPVEDIMSCPLITIEDTQSIEAAGELMAEREIRHLAVTAGERVVGLLSVRDLLSSVHLLPITVERMMARLPVIVPTTETIRNTAALMAQASVSGVLVAGQRQQPRGLHFHGFARHDIAGIVTGTDMVRDVINEDLDPYVAPVRAIMASPLFTLSDAEEVMTALAVMARSGVRHLAVTSGNEITGLLSVEDIIDPAWLHVASA